MGRPLAGASVAVAGAGGAAHAVVYACVAAGARRVTIGNRSAEAAGELATRFGVEGRAARRRRSSRRRSSPRTSRSTRRPSAWSTRGSRSTSTRLPARRDGLRPRLRPGRDAAPRRRPGPRPARRERLRDADPAGRDRVRALDRRRWHGRRDADRRRAAPRRPDGPGVAVRLATIRDDGRLEAALIEGVRVLPLADSGLTSVREIAAGGSAALDRVAAWGDRAPADAWRPLDDVEFGPAIPDPGAIYTIGLNYAPGGRPGRRPPGAAARLRQAADERRRRRRDPDLGPGADAERRRGVRARRRRRRRGGGLRLHDRRRRLVARPVARRRPVAARQVDGRVLPGRPVDRHRRRARPRRRCGSAARSTATPIQDGSTVQLRFGDRRDPRVPQPPRRAPARRPDRDRDARPPRRPHRPRRPPLAG